jgi:hypothetical protein
MNTITVVLTDEQSVRLREKAAYYEISPEALVVRGVEELLDRPDEEFESLIDHILTKNAELYRRLA